VGAGEVDEDRKAHADALDDAHLAPDVDRVAYIEQVGEDDGEAGDHVLDNALRTETDREADHRCARQIGGERYSKLREREAQRSEVHAKDEGAGDEARYGKDLGLGMHARAEHAPAGAPDEDGGEVRRERHAHDDREPDGSGFQHLRDLVPTELRP
jgi:hypothetical protein